MWCFLAKWSLPFSSTFQLVDCQVGQCWSADVSCALKNWSKTFSAIYWQNISRKLVPHRLEWHQIVNETLKINDKATKVSWRPFFYRLTHTGNLKYSELCIFATWAVCLQAQLPKEFIMHWFKSWYWSFNTYTLTNPKLRSPPLSSQRSKIYRM